MCGIAGIVRFDDAPIDRGRARAMMAMLKPRGPDDEGILELPRCTLAHTRLAVLDASGGAQPMTLTRDGETTLAVVFNGEIYNHRTLRSELLRVGHDFRSDHSDTEVLLQGHSAWGTDLTCRLEGMFAYAVWDAAARSLTLSRDRFGEKPLFFWRSMDGRELVFASTVAAVCAGLPRKAERAINREALVDYLRFGYVVGHSLVAGIEEVPPRTFMAIGADGQISLEVYWAPAPRCSFHTPHAASALTDAIEEAVAARLEADVPLGCLLSGGVDSSLVAAMAQRTLAKLGTKPLRTFTVRMPDDEYDESPYARRVAAHLGTRHTELIPELGKGMLGDLDAILVQSGEPTGDSSILPTYWICRAMREHVTVALAGDGGDELFGGYDRYTAIRWLAKYRRWIARLPGSGCAGGSERSMRTRFGRLVAAAQQPTLFKSYRQIVGLFSDDAIASLGIEATADPGPVTDWPHDAEGALDAAMQWDVSHYMPGDVLRKVDRASMAVGLEIRSPLLDTRVAELAMSLPVNALMPRGQRKGLLRQIAGPLLPRGITNRPKRGFALPIGKWMRTSLRDGVKERLLDGPLGNHGFRRASIEALWNDHLSANTDHTHRLFALLTLSIWLARNH